MNQVKYPAYAFLLFFLLAAVAMLINRFITEQPAGKESKIVSATPSIKDTAIVNTEGKMLYEMQCAFCHGKYGIIDGPSVRTAESRGPWTERKNLIRWIKDPEGTTPQFEYTRQLVAQFNGQIMPPFPHLSDRQIEAILDYLKELNEKKLPFY